MAAALLSRRSVNIGGTLLFALALIFILPLLTRSSLNLIRVKSFERKVQTFDFQDSDVEQQCFAGTAVGTYGLEVEPIPKIVHFIWLRNPELTFIGYLAIRAALINLKPDVVKLHHTDLDVDNKWFRRLEGDILLVRHDLEWRPPEERPRPDPKAKVKPKQREELRRDGLHGWEPAHISDLLRFKLLDKEGGIYIDADVLALQSFDNILQGQRDVVLGHEGGNRAGLCNSVIIARRNATFIHRWREAYKSFNPDENPTEWNYYSVVLPKALAQEIPDEICTLSPSAFFWPTWTTEHLKFMHEELSHHDALKFKDDLLANNGSVFDGQLAYHAWSQVAWEPYLRHLTLDRVMSEDTRFNMMVRKLL